MIYTKVVENHLAKLSIGNDVKENWKHLKDVILEAWYQYFWMHVGWHDLVYHVILGLMRIVCERGKGIGSWHATNIERQWCERKKRLFKLQPSLAWIKFNGKKEHIKREFTNEEILQDAQSVYMHEGIIPMV